jgi:restriction system protein
MRQHQFSRYGQSVARVELETYKFRFESETIVCIYCGNLMDDQGDPDLWPYRYFDFAEHFPDIVRDAVEVIGVPESSSHLKLSGHISDRQSSLHICPMCGWWAAVDSAVLPAVGRQFWLVNLVSHAALVDFDLADIEAPIDEVRRYLCRRFESRYDLHPRLFEQTVASVFRDLGYQAQATAFTNDGGVDIVLRSPNDERIAVQVKRRRRNIEVEQIRSFLGALMLGGLARGIFVSTAKFQRGAVQAAQQCEDLHCSIELVDSDKFLDMLGVAQLATAPNPETCGFGENPKPPSFLHSYYHLNSI